MPKIGLNSVSGVLKNFTPVKFTLPSVYFAPSSIVTLRSAALPGLPFGQKMNGRTLPGTVSRIATFESTARARK